VRRIVPILVTIAVAAGCSDPFKPQNEVDHPRVLGIVADPPEPAFDGTTALEAVVAYPEEFASLAWSACPLSLGTELQYACAMPEMPIPGDGATSAFPGTALKPWLDALKMAFADFVGFIRQVVRQKDYCTRDMIAAWDACVAGQETPPQECVDAGHAKTIECLRSGGIEVVFHLAATLKDGTVLHAYKTARFRDATADWPPNAIPRLEGVKVGDHFLKGGELVEVESRRETQVLPVFAGGAVESCPDPDGNRNDEKLWVSWYSTAGDFSYARSTYEFPENRFTLPGIMDPESDATVWVFVYDDRYGVSYLTFTARPAGWTPDANEEDAAGGEDVAGGEGEP
jgi:hypothetical protein